MVSLLRFSSPMAVKTESWARKGWEVLLQSTPWWQRDTRWTLIQHIFLCGSECFDTFVKYKLSCCFFPQCSEGRHHCPPAGSLSCRRSTYCVMSNEMKESWNPVWSVLYKTCQTTEACGLNLKHQIHWKLINYSISITIYIIDAIKELVHPN